MAFDVHQEPVSQLLSNCLYRVPRNQRRYVWGERNWEDLLQDLTCVATGLVPCHFIGSIVLKREKAEADLNVFTVIDGQQRLITLTILLDCLALEFNRRRMTSSASGVRKFLEAEDMNSQRHLIVQNDHHLTLARLTEGALALDPDEETPSVTSFVFRNTVSEEKDRQIVKAFKHFSSHLVAMDNAQLLKLRDATISTTYISIRAPSEEDSYTIFEVLNARGTSLEPHELLKNYIMRYIHPQEKRDEAQLVWQEIEGILGKDIGHFLCHYATHPCPPLKDRVTDPYRQITESSNRAEMRELLYDLQKKATYYSRIVSPPPGDHPALLFFKAHRVQIFRPLIMSLMSCKDWELITEKEYADSLAFLYRFLCMLKSCVRHRHQPSGWIRGETRL